MWTVMHVHSLEVTVVIFDHILAKTVILYSYEGTQPDSETPPHTLQGHPGPYALKSNSHELTCIL